MKVLIGKVVMLLVCAVMWTQIVAPAYQLDLWIVNLGFLLMIAGFAHWIAEDITWL